MSEVMKADAAVCKLYAALAKAQRQMTAAKKDSDNPYFKSRYADLASVMEACREPLASNGLCYIQRVTTAENTITVETILCHEDGGSIGHAITMPVAKWDAQGIGSAITYGRRYGLSTIVGVCAEDDDGNAAAKGVANEREKHLATLKNVAVDGMDALERAWKGLPNEVRKMLQSDLPGLKELAGKANA